MYSLDDDLSLVPRKDALENLSVGYSSTMLVDYSILKGVLRQNTVFSSLHIQTLDFYRGLSPSILIAAYFLSCNNNSRWNTSPMSISSNRYCPLTSFFKLVHNLQSFLDAILVRVDEEGIGIAVDDF